MSEDLNEAVDEEANVKPPGNLIAGVIKAMRPRQWVKNVLVLAAPLSAAGRGHRYDYGQLGIQVLVAFVVFSLAASGVLGVPIYDTQCGAKLFRADDVCREVFRTPFLSRWIFDVEIFARYFHLLGLSGTSIFEHVLEQWHEVGGSKLRGRDFLRAPLELMRTFWIYRVRKWHASRDGFCPASSGEQTMPFMPSFTALSTLSASGFLVAATSPAEASRWRFLDQLAGICRLMSSHSSTGPSMGGSPAMACVAASFTRFS